MCFLFALLVALILPPLAFVAFVLARWLSPRRHPEADLPYIFIQSACIVLVRLFYRTRRIGLENIPERGGAILICNHVSYADAAILGAYSPRPIRFLSWEGFERTPFMRLLMRSAKTIPVSPNKAKEAVRRACECLSAGELIGIFPEGQLTRTGALNEFRPGYGLIARISGAPVLPAYVDGLWGSFFSHRDGAPFSRRPSFRRRPITLRFGPLLTETSLMKSRQALLELGADAFSERAETGEHLLRAVVRSAGRRPGRTAIIDRASGRMEFSAARTAAAARALSKRLLQIAPEERVGIILPPGIPGVVANYACLMAGKVPVNLNFTLGRAALEQCFASAGIRTVLTVGAFREKVSEKLDVPWPANTVDVAEELRALKTRIVVAEAQVRLLPVSLLLALWRVPSEGGDAEATVLFTSGSSGAPKGVVLSHRNILSNAEQLHESGVVPAQARLLANLPIFHSFGHTVTLWYAFTRGVLCVCTPSPLDVSRNITVMREERVNIAIGTPTFLRGYLKRLKPGELPCLGRVVVGAEKTPAGFAEEWETKVGGRYYEGYGATETSPVVSVNVPDVPDSEAPGGVRLGNKAGSVGRLFPGMSVRIIDMETGEEADFNRHGLLHLRGPNVFRGYLGDPGRTSEVLRDGWYCTGDIARMDEEGFLYIEGRLSRFSKLGGEMVPHGVVEEAVNAALGLSPEGEPSIAIAGRSDAQKGEALVLLATMDVDMDLLRRKLAEAGLANLWIPKLFLRVPAIPVLASGKLDLRELRRLAAA